MNTIVIVTVSLVVLVWLARFLNKIYENDPAIWARAINKFSSADQEDTPPASAALFIGSSSIRFWDSLKNDMAPLPVINRGFGGSMIHQIIHYMDRIVLPYKPRAIFFYAGENDISGILFSKKISAEQVAENFKTFSDLVHRQLPHVKIHYISIKPPKTRRQYWPAISQSNTLIEAYCNSEEHLRYIDIVPAMLSETGEARPDLFKFDGIHMNKNGYAIWTQHIKPIVDDLFAENAQAPTSG